MSETNHIISLQEATALTHAYQSALEFAGKTVASKISASAYQSLISQPGCEGVRTYFALKEGILTIVVVGVDANDNDMTSGVILDRGLDCPQVCSLNSDLMI
jgi:hypothetical protein|tara:strand:+ start:6056 stop:6361 length:306 start_codon:yes stop_codon:yes gene_type:complete